MIKRNKGKKIIRTHLETHVEQQVWAEFCNHASLISRLFRFLIHIWQIFDFSPQKAPNSFTYQNKTSQTELSKL